MAANSKIEWCEHTFNPWVGCQQVGPACLHCYAEAWAKRAGRDVFGPHAERQRTADRYWREPLKWDAEAKASGTRPFVFCASLADVFDNAVPDAWRHDLFELILATPHLVWLLLTKRPGNIVDLFERAAFTPDMATWPGNAAMGFTAANQDELDRDLPKALAAFHRFRAPCLFISYEPALGPMVLPPYFLALGRRGWFICGGESGPNARPARAGWFRGPRDQCAAAGVPFLFKQWGEHLPEAQFDVQGFQWAPGDHRGPHVHWWEEPPPYGEPIPDDACAIRIGKRQAGRSLDGVIHDGRPVA